MLYLILITEYFAVTIFTSSRYISMTRFMEKNKDDDELYSGISSAEYQEIHVVCVYFLKLSSFYIFRFFVKTTYQ